MSLYTKPTLHNGTLNTVFNTSDFEENSTALTIGTADSRYLKLSGGTEIGNVTFNQGLTSSATITTPTITFTTAGMSQTSAQLGFFRNLSLSSGVYIVSYYHNITCTASVTFTKLVHGITTSSTGNYTQATSQSSYASEIMDSGNKYISGTYTFRTGGTVSIYAPITMTYTTAGTITDTLGMTAIRIA